MTTDATTSPRADGADPSSGSPTDVRAGEAGSEQQPALAPPARHRRPWHWVWRRLPRYSIGGTVGALAFGYSTFTPSLLPRGWVLQGLIAGITAAIGCGIGAFVAWVVRPITAWRPGRAYRRRAWQALAVVGPLLGIVMLWLGQGWQAETHRLMGMEPPAVYDAVGIVLVAVPTFAFFVGISRGILHLTRWVVRRLGRLVPHRLARPLGVTIVTVLVIFLINGVLFQGLVDAANSAFSLKDGGTEKGAVEPTAPERSGSPNSLVPWGDLGLQGRNFVGTGPTQQQLRDFSGRRALEPVRVYSSLATAADVDDRAALAVRELERAGGFGRKVLVVVTTTGTGWVDPAASDSLEYEFNGDTAMVGMQYSYLPSWLSFLVDQTKAKDAGRALFDHVYAAWSQLPADSRPRLLVFGESLGTFGGEAAFSGLDDIRDRTNGVLWAGPPNFNEMWRELVAEREPSSPEWLPVYDAGRTVRWADAAPDLNKPTGTWGEPRLVYLQNASDPIVWWTPRLIFSRPDWLKGTNGPDVSQAMPWLPVVTFWQVTADMAFSTGVPEGHGHHYAADYVNGWADVAQPPGWTASDTERLRQVIG
ncbi:MAG: alpha/beta hydrolase [Blastococcus sp.]